MEATGVSSSSRSTSVRHRSASPINDGHRLQVLFLGAKVLIDDNPRYAIEYANVGIRPPTAQKSRRRRKLPHSPTTETPPLADDGGAGSPLLADDDAATSSSAPLSQTATMQFQFFSSSRISYNGSFFESAYSSGSSPMATIRVSRIVKTEAQEALFDYLHFTRNMGFTDAEHISKNSPTFVQSLLSEIDTDKDVGRSLTRFFRYHPINEFEPFLESLGLCPSELRLLLPKHLMYLSDDPSMLENYHVLCDYGIPRIKIGNMYKKAKEIFGYDSGVMYSKLKGYENLGLKRHTVIKLVSSCPLLLIGSVDSDFVEVLRKLKGLGIENDWIGGLLKLGLKMDDAVDFLLEIGMPIKDIAEIVTEHMEFIGLSTLKGPRTVYKELKVGRSGLCQLMKEDPLRVLRLATKLELKRSEHVPCPNPSSHLEKASFLVNLGYVENSDEMTKALKKFRGRGDQLQERFDCLVQAGLDCNVVAEIIKRAPMVLNQSKDHIEKKIDRLQNSIGYPLESLIAFPSYLCYNMERIDLRFSMYVWLRDRGAAKPMLKLSTLLSCSDSRFEKYFVDIHPDGPVIQEAAIHSGSHKRFLSTVNDCKAGQFGNEYLTHGIRNNLNNTLWTVALVYGFFKQVKLSVSDRIFKLILIARRSRHYAGTRYSKRGVNEKGRVAKNRLFGAQFHFSGHRKHQE
ncbi:hypothetical protein F8388_009869 [Cannabis sativa]|uniref:SAC domain-containing protein n=1 Tax=Cannabis sativa TaxID=3483 RepID=A0A7J6H3A0_CANSA|nr:hypothetical protein F8388_009869 [Cannabis sativa]